MKAAQRKVPGKRDAVRGAGQLLVATDGTQQSAAAVALTRLISQRKNLDARAVIAVARPRSPWGSVDSGIAIDYARSIRADSIASAKKQLAEFGDSSWPFEARSGKPASVIAALARSMDARLVVVGLGEHGALSRLFGSETALHLMRISGSPVLAVARGLHALPRRIVIGIDFTEASIEAARLALEIAEDKATIVLAHVIPWDRKDYVPENWVRSHEGRITAELSRVTHWLDASARFTVEQKILYGRAGPRLLAFAAEFGADLIVGGGHSRSRAARIVAGHTIGSLIRGASCSVLVLPTSAAFHKFGTSAPAFDTAGAVFATPGAGARKAAQK